MNKEVFVEILDKLENLSYFFISGVSVAIHTKGERNPGDIDVVVDLEDINIFAKKLGAVPEKRKINKGTFEVEDFGFEINYKGQMVECTTGYPLKRSQEGTMKRLFDRKVETDYLGMRVYVEPLEELVNQKAFMHREKDINDLNLLKGKMLDKELFLEISKDKGNLDIVLPIVGNLFVFK